MLPPPVVWTLILTFNHATPPPFPSLAEDQLDVCVWQVTFGFAQALCAILADYFPEFHRLCRRVQRVGGVVLYFLYAWGIRVPSAGYLFAPYHPTTSHHTTPNAAHAHIRQRALPAADQEARGGVLLEDGRLTEPMLQNILERFNHLLASAVNMEWKHFGAVRGGTALDSVPLPSSDALAAVPEADGRRLPAPKEEDEHEKAGKAADHGTDESWVAAFIRPSLAGHSLITAFFSTRIVNAAVGCFEQVKGIRLPSQGTETFGIFEAVKKHLIHAICEGMVTGRVGVAYTYAHAHACRLRAQWGHVLTCPAHHLQSHVTIGGRGQ
jgi:hypothetical protein